MKDETAKKGEPIVTAANLTIRNIMARKDGRAKIAD
jgi:hypothetical protein